VVVVSGVAVVVLVLGAGVVVGVVVLVLAAGVVVGVVVLVLLAGVVVVFLICYLEEGIKFMPLLNTNDDCFTHIFYFLCWF